MSALLGLRKETIRSVIVCEDREFKNWAVQMLIGAAFPSEKFTVGEIEKAITMCGQDRKILNVVIHGKLFAASPQLETALAKFLDECPECRFLVCISDPSPALTSLVEESKAHVHLADGAIKQADFNRAFHNKKKRSSLEDVSQKISRAKSTGKTPTKAAPSQTALETSAHLKETVTHLNQVAKDMTDTAAFYAVAQRFNGLIGAFPYFEKNSNYAVMKNLAEKIDLVGRAYQADKNQAVARQHYDFVKAAAICCFEILKNLRDNSPTSAELLGKAETCAASFDELKDIDRGDRLDQDDIDALILAEAK